MILGNWALLAQILVSAEEKQPSIIYFDWTLFYQAGLFLLLMFFLSKVLFKPMLAVFEAREQAHLTPEKLAREAAARAAQATESYNRIREEALATGERIRTELGKDAAERQRSLMAEAKQKADGILDEARRSLAESHNQLRLELPGKAESLAALLADRLLGRQG